MLVQVDLAYRSVILSSVIIFTIAYKRYTQCERDFAFAVVLRPRSGNQTTLFLGRTVNQY